ncbi:MAG TPA: TlyA family RNA methyltransferase [Firmicutes bacterium]|nr:TlyA family RNA methyltransferase [Bacillota bacterium]
MAEKKERLDVLLAKRGFFPSRQRAQAAIMAGLVLVNGEKIEKAGTRVDPGAAIRILGQEHPYVSRGGLKLEKALKTFAIVLEGKVVMDVGASTGGFTDCALQHGAKRVYAVDVGWNQLAWRLRQDPRVIVLERTNIRYLEREAIPEAVDFACIDVSFISLEKVLPKVAQFLPPGGEVVALVKPQFEAGPAKVGKKGVVRDPAVHEEVLLGIGQAARSMGFGIEGLAFSPISGAQGNREYLLYLRKGKEEDLPLAEMVRETVAAAWQEVT